MRLSLIIFGFIIFSSCKIIQPSKNDMVKINNISVYKDFYLGGYTTMGAYTHFDEMKKEGIQTIMVSDIDVKKIEQILNTAERLKHFQRKLAGGLIFCKFTFDNNLSESRVVIGTGTTFSLIMDLTDRKDYVVKDSSDLKWLSEFAEQIRNR